MQFRNRQVYIHTDLKWASQYQNGLEMPQLTADWPGHTLRDPKGPKGCLGPIRGQSWHLEAHLALLLPLQVIPSMTLSSSESHFVFQISQPPNIGQKLFCIQNLQMDISFQEEKTVYKYVTWFTNYSNSGDT